MNRIQILQNQITKNVILRKERPNESIQAQMPDTLEIRTKSSELSFGKSISPLTREKQKIVKIILSNNFDTDEMYKILIDFDSKGGIIGQVFDKVEKYLNLKTNKPHKMVHTSPKIYELGKLFEKNGMDYTALMLYKLNMEMQQHLPEAKKQESLISRIQQGIQRVEKRQALILQESICEIAAKFSTNNYNPDEMFADFSTKSPKILQKVLEEACRDTKNRNVVRSRINDLGKKLRLEAKREQNLADSLHKTGHKKKPEHTSVNIYIQSLNAKAQLCFDALAHKESSIIHKITDPLSALLHKHH